MKLFLRSQPTKALLLLVGAMLLSACGSAAKQTIHPYIKDIRDIESQAVDALQKNRFRSAYHYSTKAYNAYAALDQVEAMARNLVNQAQIALLIEDLNRAEHALGILDSLIIRESLTSFSDRAKLLNVNLAIAKQDWSMANESLERLGVLESKRDSALRESAIVARQLIHWGLGDRPEFSSDLSIALVKARQLRLKSEVALADGDKDSALRWVSEAKQIYQAETFTPGVAECLVLEAKLSDDEEIRKRLRNQAKLAFNSMLNSRAIERHGL